MFGAESVGTPVARTVYYNYGTAGGTSDVLSRLDNLSASGGTPVYAQYTYLGASTIVQVAHPAVSGGLTLTYKGAAAGSYAGFDRFGRIVWQKWSADSTVVARYFYGYNRNSNRLWRADRPGDVGVPGRDEVYAYDGLDRLIRAKRGTHPSNKAVSDNVPYPGDANRDGTVDVLDYVIVSNNNNQITNEWERGDLNGDGKVDSLDLVIVSNNYGTPTESLTAAREWSLEALGNWKEFKEDAGDGSEWDLDQDRTHNAVNEVQTASGWVTPAHDAAGNMIRAPRPGDEATAGKALLMVWDAWNRLTQVWEDTNEDGDLDAEPNDTHVLTLRYDGLGRRIQKIVEEEDVTYDYYYNASWQIVEVHRSDYTYAPYEQYVWDIRYIDAPVLRWRDTEDSGTLDETLYYCNDANMNVTALVNTSGTVVERVTYDPYGKPKFYNGTWQNPSDTSAFDNAILYCGYYFDDESGLYSVRHRYYDFALGRWPTRDWDYYDGMNLYEYVGGSPTLRRDAYGLSWEITHPVTIPRLPPPEKGIDCGVVVKRVDVHVYAEGPTKDQKKRVKEKDPKGGDKGRKGTGDVRINVGHTWIEYPGGSVGFFPGDNLFWGKGSVPPEDHHLGEKGDHVWKTPKSVDAYRKLEAGPPGTEGKTCCDATCEDVYACMESVGVDWNETLFALFGRNCRDFVKTVIRKCCLIGGPDSLGRVGPEGE